MEAFAQQHDVSMMAGILMSCTGAPLPADELRVDHPCGMGAEDALRECKLGVVDLAAVEAASIWRRPV